jgi:hypothetical protein
MDNFDERNVDPIQEMARLANSFFNLDRWNFRESYRSGSTGNLIYDSKLCRVNLVWGGWDSMSGNTISIYYGRLHAPDESSTMTWNGEECHCWHRIEHILHFLDGRTPTDAAKLNFSHEITKPFYEEEFRQKFRYRQPEWLVRMHAMIWQHYNERLFNFFDLSQQYQWIKYQQFLKELYDIRGRSRAIKPSLDKVC